MAKPVETKAKPDVFGVLAEFKSAADLLTAANKIREAGYTKFDCHSPFPIHGMDRAMGLKRSPLGYIVGVFAFSGLAAMTLFIYWITSVDYPLVISGKPYFSYQAFVPVLFAIAILSAALSATFGMMRLNRLPRLHHPLFSSPQFSRVTDGGFFVSIEASDSAFDRERTREFLQSLGANDVAVITEEEG